MAQSSSEILNSRTGQRTIFLRTAADTDGAYLRTETFHPPHQPQNRSMYIRSKRVAARYCLERCAFVSLVTSGQWDPVRR